MIPFVVTGAGKHLSPLSQVLTVSCLNLSVPLLHGPDADDDPAADPEHPGELSQRPHAALRRGDVVDHGDRQRRVHALVAERQRQVITVENLQCSKLTS